ncbi:MAG: glucose 1-dehydrogenase [Rhodospirillales bacterium]|nr:glucose 1-dehydrogenase [Rhodospirillales bacterium]
MRFRNRAAMVTGGGDGIGQATALRLAAEGAAVLIADIDAAAAGRSVAAITAAGGRAEASVGSVTEAADVAAAVALAIARFGAIDVLVNNAAFTASATLADCAPADWDREFAVTLRGAFLCARAVLPHMTARGRGAIVNIGSVNGLMYFGNPAYSAAKAGLLSLTRSLAVEAGPRGVRTNMVSPGSVRTGNPSWTARQRRDPAIFEKLARWYPVGRVGRPEDIAAAVCFLAADEAAFVNGANLVVDGGLTAGMGVMAQEINGEG